MKQTLRPYQIDALNRLRDGIRRGVKRQILMIATGGGKTSVAAEMITTAVGRGKRVLFLAHRRELIDQCSARLDQFSIEHGVIMAGHRRYQPMLQVQIASVQTLVRREVKPRADLIVVDECHHARAGSYQKILDCYPTAPVVGLSATPWRMDGRGLGELFEEIVVGATTAELIKQGHLVPFTGFAYDAPDLSNVERRGGDYDEHGLELVMGGVRLLGNIVGQWQAHAAGLRTVVFAVTVAHSKEIVERFRHAGVAAEHVDGETPTELRAAILERLRTGETTVVSNVGVLTEGWDLPSCEVCILARPTQSVGLYLQMVGRVLRPAPGKAVARIHDHAGCIVQHGPPDYERDYSLDADVSVGKRKSAKPPPMRTCLGCFAIYTPELEACPACGFVDEKARRPPQEIQEATAIPIEEIKAPGRHAGEGTRRAVLRTLLATAQRKNYKAGWASYRFKAQFGDFPPKGWMRELAPAESERAA